MLLISLDCHFLEKCEPSFFCFVCILECDVGKFGITDTAGDSCSPHILKINEGESGREKAPTKAMVFIGKRVDR